jgi:uncharacterized protein (DUF3084 family)
MPDPTDVIYEIASTDAWKKVLGKLQDIGEQYLHQVYELSLRSEPKLEQITKAAGRAEAIQAVLKEFRSLGEKGG